MEFTDEELQQIINDHDFISKDKMKMMFVECSDEVILEYMESITDEMELRATKQRIAPYTMAFNRLDVCKKLDLGPYVKHIKQITKPMTFEFIKWCCDEDIPIYTNDVVRCLHKDESFGSTMLDFIKVMKKEILPSDHRFWIYRPGVDLYFINKYNLPFPDSGKERMDKFLKSSYEHEKSPVIKYTKYPYGNSWADDMFREMIAERKRP